MVGNIPLAGDTRVTVKPGGPGVEPGSFWRPATRAFSILEGCEKMSGGSRCAWLLSSLVLDTRVDIGAHAGAFGGRKNGFVAAARNKMSLLKKTLRDVAEVPDLGCSYNRHTCRRPALSMSPPLLKLYSHSSPRCQDSMLPMPFHGCNLSFASRLSGGCRVGYHRGGINAGATSHSSRHLGRGR